MAQRWCRLILTDSGEPSLLSRQAWRVIYELLARLSIVKSGESVLSIAVNDTQGFAGMVCPLCELCSVLS